MKYIVTWIKGPIKISDTIYSIDEETAIMKSMMKMESNGFNTNKYERIVKVCKEED